MKKSRVLFGLIGLVLIIGLMVVSCGGSDPSSVVKKFHNAVLKGDTKVIGELVVPEASGMVTMFLGTLKEELAKYGDIESAKQTIDGDTAVVEVTYKSGDTDDYELIKTNGKWLITMNK